MRNIKCQIIALFLSVLLIFVIFPSRNSFAATIDSGDCGDNLTWSLDDNGHLSFSGTGDMFYWADSGKVPWWYYSDTIRSVDIPVGVTSIGNFAFYNCRNLTNISIPNGVTSIGICAFGDCSGLTSITIPSGVKKIANGTFLNCTSLKVVSIPNSVTLIDFGAFGNCSDLTSIYIPNSVNTIANSAFSGCSGLTKVSGGAKVKTIGRFAFAYCPKLKSFTITSSKLKSIGSEAFFLDKSLKTISLKKTTKLTKSGVRNSLKGSAIKTVKVKKSKVRKYKKYFKKSNSGRKVKVKK